MRIFKTRTDNQIKEEIRHRMLVRAEKQKQASALFKIDVLRAFKKHDRFIDLICTAFVKTKKLTKSFFDKPIHIGKNLW